MDNRSLSGSDVFQLLLDRSMRKAGQSGNISRILYRLNPEADLNQLQERLFNSKLLDKVNSLQVEFRFWRAPYWKEVSFKGNAVVLHSNQLNTEAESSLWNVGIEKKNGLVRIDLYHDQHGKPSLLISMHHVLFDHRGMLQFVNCLNEDSVPERFIQKNQSRPIGVIWKHAFEVAEFSFGSSGWGLTTVSKPVSKPRTIYRFIHFTKEETKQIEKSAIENGANLSFSVYLIAMLMQAFEKLANEQQAKGSFIWMAAPHDMRKKGEEGHLIGNDLSFIYFRKERNGSGTMNDLITNLNGQLRHQIKAKLPQKHADFLRLYSHVPLWAYKAMTDLAHGGKVSSFAFSDLGESQPPKTFLGATLEEVCYLSPVPLKPGISVVAHKANGALSYSVGLVEGMIGDELLDGFCTGIHLEMD
ncbi:MAG: hypothetical protein ACI85F_001162 [Bacteroidia bacterium]|jgi:hypothetical protein